MQLRLADARTDATAIAAIYAPHVVDGFASFESVAPSDAEVGHRIASTLPRLPWLVAEEDADLTGYAYASPHHDRAAYRWSVDVSVYVAERWHRRGIGTRLYGALFAILRGQGFLNAYAGIAQPNAASIRLHRSMGMTAVGTYHGVGFKGGTWRDVTWVEMALADRTAHPAEPVPLAAFLVDGAGREATERALRTE